MLSPMRQSGLLEPCDVGSFVEFEVQVIIHCIVVLFLP